MDHKLVAAKLTLPDAQVQAINIAVAQITAALGVTETIPAMIRAKAAQLNEMADLFDVLAEDKMPDEEKKGGDEEKPEAKPEEK